MQATPLAGLGHLPACRRPNVAALAPPRTVDLEVRRRLEIQARHARIARDVVSSCGNGT